MIPLSFNSLLIVAGISVLVPVVLGLLPRLPVPGAVLMVLGGIVVGPSVLNWARIDAPVEVLSDLGLGILLFLAELEIDDDRLRSPLTRVAGVAFGCSAALALLCAVLFWLAGPGTQPIPAASGGGAGAGGRAARPTVRVRADPRLVRGRAAGPDRRELAGRAQQGVPDQAGRDRVRLPGPDLLRQHRGGLPAQGPRAAARGARRGAAVPARPAGRSRRTRPALRPRDGPPPGRGGRPAAGHHAYVRDRGDGDRGADREAHRGHVGRPGRGRAAIGRPVPGRGRMAARPRQGPLRNLIAPLDIPGAALVRRRVRFACWEW